MSSIKTSLAECAKNIYSQSGEDGIIREILLRLSKKISLSKWCVEFGAWDGIHLSNTCNLLKSDDYSAVLIEADPVKYKQLCTNFPEDKIHKICQFVGFSGDQLLDNILSKTPIPTDFDFLSIDIDGCDYYILESLQIYRPKVICIEYNPTIPNELEFVQEKDFSISHGSSALSIFKLAQQKNYRLVAVTRLNLILVREDVAAIVEPEFRNLNDLRDDSEFKTYLFVGYDGSLHSNRYELQFPWHSLSVPVYSLNPLPKNLQIFPTNYTQKHHAEIKKLAAAKKINISE